MSQHRFADLIPTSWPPSFSATPTGSGFMLCPLAVLPIMQGQLWQRQVYERAFQEAQAVVRPSILDRLQAATNN